MANFDPNQWYQVAVKSDTGFSMGGSSLYDHGLGAVYFVDTNTTLPTERWQFFPFNSTTYTIRLQEAGPDGYLGTAYSANETTPGQTRPEMRNYTVSDNSMYWQVTPWEDGTFYLTNLANGTAWHLEVNPDTLMAMSSNFTKPQDGASFSFTQLASINNSAYSTINSPVVTSSESPTGATSTNQPTYTSSPDPTQSTPTLTGSSGLSSGVSAAIGASIGGVALSVILAGLFFWNRKRGRRNASVYTENGEYMTPTHYARDPPKELPHSSPPAELMTPMAELDGQTVKVSTI